MKQILVTGVGSLLGQGILKSLNASSMEFKIIGTDYFPHSVGLYWVDKGYLLPDVLRPEVNEEDWLGSLIKIINQEKIDILLPGLDFEIPILTRFKNTIEEQTDSIILVNPEDVVNIGNDKWETVNYLKNNNFYYPKSCLPDEVDSFLIDNSYPFIVKPRFGHTSKNVYLVNNESQLYDSIEKCDRPIIQEYVGDSENEYTCGATCIDSQVITLISLRRTLKNGNTQQAFCEKTDEIDKYIKKLTLSLNPYGPINFQLRITSKGPTVFEINPRFSGTTPIRALFGVNEVEAVIKRLLGEKDYGEYKEKEGVVLRYFENEFIPLDRYEVYSL